MSPGRRNKQPPGAAKRARGGGPSRERGCGQRHGHGRGQEHKVRRLGRGMAKWYGLRRAKHQLRDYGCGREARAEHGRAR